MKKLLIVLSVLLFLASPVAAQLVLKDNTTATPTLTVKNYEPTTLLNSLVNSLLTTSTNSGYVDDIATPTFSIDSDDIVEISDYLPTGINGFELRAASGSFIVGGNTIATSPVRIGRLISEGESYQWNGAFGTPNVYIKTTQDSSLVVIDGAW